MDKTSFARLNKLFMISAGERDHETLPIEQNLLSLVWDPESYVVFSISCFVAKVLVLDEHYVVKDLPFYEEAQTTNVKARQDRLATREKKRYEGTLKQASGGSRLTTSSTAHPFSKKKSTPRHAEKALDLSPPPSSPSSPSTSTKVGVD